MTDLPTIVQGSALPVLRIVGGGSESLVCERCEKSVLVENFRRECVVGIGIECHACGHVTRTPSRPSGERFPRQVMLLRTGGRYRIESTVEQPSSVVVTSDAEIEREREQMSIRDAPANAMEVSLDGIALIETELDILSGGRFRPHIEAARRALSRGNRHFLQNALAWALTRLRQDLEGGVFNVEEETAMAMAFVMGYKTMASRWRHHPIFPAVANELCSSYQHCHFLLTAASYLEDSGNNVSFKQTTAERTADLFVQATATERLYLEVKAPAALAWPGRTPTRNQLKRIVENALKSARGQISRTAPGVLVIGATRLDAGFLSLCQSAIRFVLKRKGASHSGVAGVTVVGLDSIRLEPIAGGLRMDTAYRVVGAQNPHYFRPHNPLDLSPDDASV